MRLGHTIKGISEWECTLVVIFGDPSDPKAMKFRHCMHVEKQPYSRVLWCQVQRTAEDTMRADLQHAAKDKGLKLEAITVERVTWKLLIPAKDVTMPPITDEEVKP